MILYDSGYEYPSAQDLKKTTQKINQLHSLGQGKLVIIQELANNTLNEIKTNISNFRKKLDITSFSNILTFARLLRDMKTVLFF